MSRSKTRPARRTSVRCATDASAGSRTCAGLTRRGARLHRAASLASASPMRDPRALAGERAHDDAGLVGGGGEVGGPLAEREPHEVALRRRARPSPASRSAGDDPVALDDQGVDPLEQRRPRRSSEATAAAWATAGDAERQRAPRAAPRRSAPARRRTRPGSRPGRRPWRRCGSARTLSWARVRRERRRRGRPSARTRGRPRRPRPARAAGTRARNASSSVCGDRRAGRVVGGADQHDLGAVGDRGGHRVEVVAAVGGAPAPAPTSRPPR